MEKSSLIAAASVGDASGAQAALAGGGALGPELAEALIRAAGNGHEKCVELLLAVNGEPEATRALGSAAMWGRARCVELLIPKADPKAQRSRALTLAAQHGHARCVELLIPASEPKDDGSWALGVAAQFGHASCVALLIPVSDPKANHCAPLRRAAERGHGDCVELLLPSSDPGAMAQEGKDAASMARKRGFLAVAARIEACAQARELEAMCQPASGGGKDRL